MDRASFLAKHTLGAGNAYTAELLDYLVGLGMSIPEIDRQIRIPQAADVSGPLKGTTVRMAFVRAARLDEAAKQAWTETALMHRESVQTARRQRRQPSA